MEEKYVIVEDGWGAQRRIPESKIPLAEEAYRELRELSMKAGDSEEDTAKYTLKITREDD